VATLSQVYNLVSGVSLVCTDPPYGVGINYGDAVEDSLAGAKELYVSFLQMAIKCAPIVLTTVGCFAL
jgi:hypothetical protein